MAELQSRDDGFPLAGTNQEFKACGLIDYDDFQVVKGITGEYVLIVYKSKPDPRINPDLVPLIYIDTPDYWEIQVIGCLIGIVPPPTRNSFPLALGLDQYMGKKGIKLVGATRSDSWDLQS